jgi:hypothetical protein
MAAPPEKTRNPAAEEPASRAFRNDRAGKLINLESNPNLPARQVAHLQRRFLLPEAVARTVAALLFAEVRS